MFKKIFLLNFIYFFIFSTAFAQIINKIEINGNKRISSKTIEIFTKINLGESYNENELNKVIRNLYETNFFKTIELNITDDLIIINVDENPIIEDVSFKGIKNSQLQKIISDSTKLKSRISYSDNVARSDLDLIKHISACVSMTGLVFEFKTISLKPLFPATFPPLLIVSLSSNPGSPKETLLSNHPRET